MPRITIPKTIEAAKAELGALGKLVTAKQWERAAIVYAFTEPGSPGEGGPGREQRLDTEALTIAGFARQKFVGLGSENTVTEYRKAWQWAIDNGMAVEVKPGDTIVVPTIEWPPGIIDHKRGSHATTDEVIEGIRKKIEADPKGTVAEIMQDHPTLARKVAEGVLANSMTKASIEVQQAAPITPRVVGSSLPTPARDFHADIVRGTGLLIEAVRAIESGQYAATGTEEMLLRLVGKMLVDMGTSKPTLFDDIDSYLKRTVAP